MSLCCSHHMLTQLPIQSHRQPARGGTGSAKTLKTSLSTLPQLQTPAHLSHPHASQHGMSHMQGDLGNTPRGRDRQVLHSGLLGSTASSSSHHCLSCEYHRTSETSGPGPQLVVQGWSLVSYRQNCVYTVHGEDWEVENQGGRHAQGTDQGHTHSLECSLAVCESGTFYSAEDCSSSHNLCKLKSFPTPLASKHENLFTERTLYV